MTPYATHYHFNRLDGLYLWDEPAVAPNTGAHDVMAESTSSIEGVLADFLASIIPKVVIEPTREALVDLHFILILNAASVASKLDRGHHGHLTLTMAVDEYLAHTCHTFFLPHKPGYYPPTLGTAQ